MKYLKMFEALEESVYEEINGMIQANDILKKSGIEANKDTVFEAGDFILLLGDLKHILDAHVDDKIPGSKFNKGIDLKKAIVGLVTKNPKPTEMAVGFGANEKTTTNPEEAGVKFKWLGLDCGQAVGIENCMKSDDKESLIDYEYKDFRGNPIKIKVKEGEGKPTNHMSYIGIKIGKVGEKYVLSLVTAFPGENGANISDRNKLTEEGFYFLTKNQEVLKGAKGTNESKTFKYLKTFESFSVNENTAGDEVYEDLLSWLYQSFLDLKLYFNKFGRYDFQGLVYPSDIVDIKGEKKNRHGFAIGISPRFEMIELAFGLPKGTFKVEIIGDEMPSDEDEVVDGKIVVSGETLFTFTSNYEKFDDDISLKIDWLVDESGKTFHQFGFVQSSENNQQSMANLGNKLDIILKKVYQSNKDRFTVEGLQQLKMNKCETDR